MRLWEFDKRDLTTAIGCDTIIRAKAEKKARICDK